MWSLTARGYFSKAPDSPQRKVYDWLDTDEGRRCIKKAGYVAVD